MLDLLPTELWDYSVADVLRGLRAALSPRQPDGTLPLPGLGDCVPARSARAGIVLAIRALELRPGARIGVPLYCCPVVFKAIRAAGCVPRFIDVDPATFCLSVADLAAKRSELDALIAVHMFGNVCDVPRLQEWLQGKPIIEDCAQSLGSRHHGRFAGSFGAISVFSFRSGKYLSVGEGGALFSNREDLRSRLMESTSDLSFESLAGECSHVVKTYTRSKLRSRPLYGLVGYPLWEFYNRKVDYSAKSPLVLTRMCRSDFILTLDRLPSLDSAIQRRRANADFYSRSLNLDPGMIPPEEPGAFCNRYQYPVVFPSSGYRDSITEYLHCRGIGTAKPYRDIAKIAAAHYGYAGDCPVAEDIARRVLVIPNHHRLDQCNIEHIARCLNTGWAELSRFREPAGPAPALGVS